METPQKHIVILIPGLGDNFQWIKFLIGNWERKHGLIARFHVMPWQGDEHEFEPKLQRLLGDIDSHLENGDKVSLVGLSAGGSAVINAFALRSDKILKVVNVCGRLRAGEDVSALSGIVGKTSFSFIKSVLRCEEVLKSLSTKQKQKILTIRPFYDEIVPVSTVTIEGAKNIQINSIEHVLSIGLALSLYSRKIIDHLFM